MTPLLHATGITVTHPGRTPLVDEIDLQMMPGEKVALLGGSGSGKSLLAAALTGTVTPALDVAGTVEFNGGIRRPGTTGLRDLVLVRQDSADALNPLVRVRAQLEIPLRALGDDPARARELLELVDLGQPERILSAYPAQLSGGQRQRVCIALGLACRPRLLIADECTTALDPVSQAAVIETLRTVDSLLFITHDISVAAQLCDRVLVVDRGRIVEDAAMNQLFGGSAHPVTRRLTAHARAHVGWAA